MKKNLLLFIFISVLVISVFSNEKSAHSQGFQLYSADDINVETVPNIPGPNEEVSLRLDSYSFNLNNYYIAWFENGEQKTAGYGGRDYVFVTGDSGETTDIKAVIEVGDQVFRKELRFSPSEVDLLWEVVDAYTPPFYKGKALPLRESTIKITAIPETQLVEPLDAPKLIYYWDNNYKRDSRASGFGKQSYIINASPISFNEKISVTANDRRENTFARNTIDIPTNTYKPKILFYEINENNRLLTQKALNTQSDINKNEIKMSFHPLHMSSTEENFVDLFVQWSINNNPQAPQSFEFQNELFISSEEDSGSLPISVDLEGIEKITQSSTEQINLFFNLNK